MSDDATPTPLLLDTPPELTERQEEFLRLVADHGTTDTAAALAVGSSRWSSARWKKDPVFKKRYDEARGIGIEKLIKEAERRAMNGSDRLLEFMLCNYAPDKFSNKQKVEHTGNLELTERLTRARNRTTTPQDDGSDLAG